MKKDLDVTLVSNGNREEKNRNVDRSNHITELDHNIISVTKLSPFGQRSSHTLSHQELEMALRCYNMD